MPTLVRPALGISLLALSAVACARNTPEADLHAEHASATPSVASMAGEPRDVAIPASSVGVTARLATSPRHGEYVMIRTGPSDSVRAWVVYPERATKAPVVVVVHEIFGLSAWVRGVADQLAADGFIAIAPDLLTMKNLPDGPDSVLAPLATAAIRN